VSHTSRLNTLARADNKCGKAVLTIEGRSLGLLADRKRALARFQGRNAAAGTQFAPKDCRDGVRLHRAAQGVVLGFVDPADGEIGASALVLDALGDLTRKWNGGSGPFT
jgi:hypothetical protein